MRVSYTYTHLFYRPFYLVVEVMHSVNCVCMCVRTMTLNEMMTVTAIFGTLVDLIRYDTVNLRALKS